VVTEIGKISADHMYKLMVIGSHGYKGLREKVLGADILKLVRDLPLPVLVIQKGYKLTDQGIKSILLVQNSRESSQGLNDAISYLSKSFDAEIFHNTPEAVDLRDRLNQLLYFAENRELPIISINPDLGSGDQYLSKNDIESLLTNSFNVPILCVKG